MSRSLLPARRRLITGLAAAGAVALASAPSALAAFPGANGRVAYMDFRGGATKIYSAEADGANRQLLTSSDDALPVFSPDGRQIAFVSSRDGSQAIYTMNADGSQQRRVTSSRDGSWGASMPSWSPDGTKIAFLDFGDEGYQLHIINANGTGDRTVTDSPDGVYFPQWSPNGDRISFTRWYDDGAQEIMTVRPDGSDERRLTNTPNVSEAFPKWSPDGTRLVFSAGLTLGTISADGGTVTPVLGTSWMDDHPSWSPDGSKLIFQRLMGQQYQIVTMALNGSSTTTVTSGEGWGHADPDWGVATVKPDTTAPTATATAPDGWSAKTATVALHAADEDGGSGVDHVVYTVGDGAPQRVGGDSASVDVDAEGATTITYHAVDKAGNAGADKQVTVRIDRTAPEASATAPDGWSSEDAKVAVGATDAGSGVDHLVIDGRSYDGDSAEVPVTTEGVTTVSYHAVDKAGNAGAEKQVTVRIDRTAPEASATAPDGWSRDDVSIKVAATDAGAGVDHLLVDGRRFDGDGATVPVTAEGVTTVSYQAVDKAGNASAEQQVTVRIDRTGPEIRFDGQRASYGLDETVKITCSASDALSGLATSACHELDVPAWQLGAGEQRLSASAGDNAGNSASASVTFTVKATAENLCALTRRFSSKDGVATGLCAKLASGALGAYANQLSAQSGKALTAEQADTLLRLSQSL